MGRNAIKSTHSFDSYKRLSYELKSQERVNGRSGVRKQSDASSAEQANDWAVRASERMIEWPSTVRVDFIVILAIVQIARSHSHVTISKQAL